MWQKFKQTKLDGHTKDLGEVNDYIGNKLSQKIWRAQDKLLFKTMKIGDRAYRVNLQT